MDEWHVVPMEAVWMVMAPGAGDECPCVVVDSEKHARLIAAAADLLEAAKAALVQAEGCFQEHYPDRPENVEAGEPLHIALLRAAIAKAEGR